MSNGMNLGGSLDLQVEPAEAERRKRARMVQLNTLVVPRLRLLGFALLSLASLLHNAFIYPGLAAFAWTPWGKLVAALFGYGFISWYLLHLFYEETRPSLDLGRVFLATDMWMFSGVIYATGADRSWMFFLPLFRVVYQTQPSFWRPTAFRPRAPVTCAAVLLYVVLVNDCQISLLPQVA